MEVQPNKRGMQQKQEMMRLDDGDGDGDDDVSVGTFQSTRRGKAPKSAHRNTERHKGDKKYLAEKIAKSQRLAEDDAVSVGGASSRSLSKYEKATGPGSMALDNKLETEKYEAQAGEASSTQQMLLPLRDALHELASLKVLNPEMAAGETLVPPIGEKRPSNDVMTTHSLKPRKRENKKSKRDKSTKILKAGGASIVSQSRSGNIDDSYHDDDVHSTLDDDDMSAQESLANPMANPMEGKPGTKSAMTGQVHAFIKERGRVFEYKSIKDRKKKVVGRLLPPEYPGSPLAAGGGAPSPPLGSPTQPI